MVTANTTVPPHWTYYFAHLQYYKAFSSVFFNDVLNCLDYVASMLANKLVRIIEEMMMTEEERKTLIQTHLSATLCITIHTWTRLGWNQDHRFDSLATTGLSHRKVSITLNMSTNAYR
jgi:hypothetical protein